MDSTKEYMRQSKMRTTFDFRQSNLGLIFCLSLDCRDRPNGLFKKLEGAIEDFQP